MHATLALLSLELNGVLRKNKGIECTDNYDRRKIVIRNFHFLDIRSKFYICTLFVSFFFRKNSRKFFLEFKIMLLFLWTIIENDLLTKFCCNSLLLSLYNSIENFYSFEIDPRY